VRGADRVPLEALAEAQGLQVHLMSYSTLYFKL
jgi:hypothetical protein